MINNPEKMSSEERIVDIFRNNRHHLDKEMPDFIIHKRNSSLLSFEKQGIPDFKNENYKYTTLRKLFDAENYKRNFSQPFYNFNVDDVFKCDVPEIDTYLLFNLNGWYYPLNSSENLPKGIIVKSFRKAIVENKDQVEKYYGKIATDGDPLVSLNDLFAQDGIFVSIPDNVVIEKPIQIINLLLGDEDLYVTQRNLVLLGKNSQAKLMFCDHTLSVNNFIINNQSEIFVNDGAVLDIYTMQNQHNGTVNLNGIFVQQMQASNLVTNTISLHGGLIRNHLHVSFQGQNAECNLFGLALTDRNQHVENFTSVEHTKPRCRSNQIFKNILDDNSTSSFIGKIDVFHGAIKTEAFQRNNSVLLTKAAKMYTKPQLVIDNDDVKCSHGATIGQVNEQALFYLQTRGINEKEAKLLLMFAFAHEVLSNIRFLPLRNSIDVLVNKRLRGEVSRCHDCKLECIK